MEAIVYLRENERELLLPVLTETEVEEGSSCFLKLLEELPTIQKPHEWRDWFGIFIYDKPTFSHMTIYTSVHNELLQMKKRNPIDCIGIAMSNNNWEAERMLRMRLIYVTLVKMRIPRMKDAEWRWWLRIPRGY